MAGAVNPVRVISAMSACVTGFSKATSIKGGMLVTVGNPLMMDKMTTSSTPAVPRSKRLSSNLTAAEVVPVMLCPGSNPTNAPEATWL